MKVYWTYNRTIKSALATIFAGLLKSAELLLKESGEVKLIRRAETPMDYFATFDGFDVFNKLKDIYEKE